MPKHTHITQYFRACYQLDSWAVSLLNFFGSKTRQVCILNNADVLEGKYEQFPIDTAYGKEVTETLLVHGKEKALYAGAFCLTGKTTVLKREVEVFAPLLLIPAHLVEDQEVYFLELNFAQAILNPAFVKQLKKEESGSEEEGVASQDNLYDALNQQLPTGPINFDALHQMEETLVKFFPNLDISGLKDFPKLFSEKEVEAARKSEHWQLIPAFVLGIIDKPFGSRGILTELDEIAKSEGWSTPLQAIFGESQPYIAPEQGTVLSPVNLSDRQKGVFHSAEHFDLSMVVGPPGTGKTYTIAALAADHLRMGKSVLIASKNDQAVDVVADKLERDLGLPGIVVRAGRRDYKKQLRKRLENLLSGLSFDTPERREVWKLSQKVKHLARQIKTHEAMIKKRKQEELHRGELIVAKRRNIWERLRLFWIKRWMADEISLQDLKQRLLEKETYFLQLIIELIREQFAQRLNQALYWHRQDFNLLKKALRTRSGNTKEEYFNKIDFSKILKLLPIWVVSANDIHHVLPLYRELFDLVIIDEASQCDIASSIPLLYRARRAVIVGDPKQLRHLSFLSRQQQQQLAEQYDLNGQLDADLLNYREHSILDVVSESITNQQQVHFLDEHYRSFPDIIAFSNSHFYENALRVMTVTPHTPMEQRLFLHQINGKRTKSGYNRKEAEALLEQVAAVVEKEKELAPELKQTIGILSPFSKQVAFLQKQIQDRFELEAIQAHRILVGTPYAFQGEERDLMYLSFTLDDDSHPSAFRYLDREDVFNVSITRGRIEQHIFLSCREEQLKRSRLLSHYVSHIQRERELKTAVQKAQSDVFLTAITDHLNTLGVSKILPSYAICGVEIDIVVVKDGQTYCIDLIGFPGPYEAATLLQEHRILQRIGMPMFTLTYFDWCMQRERVEEELVAFLS